jgi:cytochrome c biogenesis protein CcmG/thiol:disulfide interchange protein DsbE
MFKRLLPLLVFVALAVLLFAGIQLNRGRDPNALPSPLIGKPAPEFALPDFRDPSKTISKQDLLGTPYLLNVWASWCPACRIEHPVIEDAARRGLIKVVGFNYKDEPDDAQRWLQQFGDPYAIILADRDGRAGIEWGVYGAPETFLVDATGIIRFKHVGPVTPEIIEQVMLPLVANPSAGGER